ncbi:hypothetical protein [Paenibacillus physcomitrellae]|uniref:Nucleotidyltransferase family protein n=1 Tax=Paenibacillus physcomitrellae TaxID=1619311 RepID=A0ABQ1FNJ0_9BACL|nr:hypothetical protein [Paenibacillus physcomitrellae]GGA22987.1 hypothetical protein GCM10010917_04680 [Paenibacillus physcomitrellae]
MRIGVYMGNLGSLEKLGYYIQERELTSNPGLERALAALIDQLEPAGVTWLAGGSVGLWLQGVSLSAQPRDIDIYAEKAAASLIHERLKPLATDEPRWDESGIYASLLSHYSMDGYTLELVGGFEVHTSLADYKVEVEPLLEDAALTVVPGLKVMPLAHEFIFNLLRGRPDRYRPIADRMNTDPGRFMPLLKQIITRNGWTLQQQAAMSQLARLEGWFD